MIPIPIIILLVVWAAVTLLVAIKYRDVRKFLAGAFFVSGGYQFYFSFVHLSIPIIGTTFTQTPDVGIFRGIIHLILAAICFYFGFIWKLNKKHKSSHNPSK